MSQTPTKDQGWQSVWDQMIAEMDGWVCPACGERPSMDAKWRCAGDRWQHHHGYPAGHLDAVQVPAPPVDATGVK